MGAVSITAAQKAELEAMYGRIGQDVHAIDVWRKLAGYGDTYAASAVAVIDRPGSAPWAVVRGIWDATGADFSKFDTVADQHARNYIHQITQRPDATHPGMYRLPSTRNIEDSYADALGRSGIDRYTAVDLVVEKLRSNTENSKANLPHWYDTPGVMRLEAERIEPTDPRHLEHMSGPKAAEVWGLTARNAAYTLRHAHPLAMEEGMDSAYLDRSFGGRKFNVETQAGVTYYYNTQTGNWAYFDQAHRGAAMMDGKPIEIGPHNWRQQPGSEQFQIRRPDGSWQTADVGRDASAQNREPSSAYAGLTPDRSANASRPANAETVAGDFSSYLDQMLAAANRGDDATFRQMTQALANTPAGQQVRAEAVAAVDQQEKLAAAQPSISQPSPTQPMETPAIRMRHG